MYQNVLLISEDVLKTYSNLNRNTFGDWILPAIRESQEMGLMPIIGECLYNKICELVADGSINDVLFTAYKDLLDDKIQPYLIYKTLSNIIPIINGKLANIGTVTTNDEHVVNLTQGESDLLKTYYSERCDFYTKRLQDFIKNNQSAFPEIVCGCGNMQPNLESSENSVGIWLGGSRGKIINDNKCSCSTSVVTCGDYQSGFTDGVEFQKRKLQITAVTENGRYISEDGFKEIAVDVQGTGHTDEELEEAYQDGVVDGTDMQKARLSAITITQNGDYDREDGYSAVTVSVEQTGHTDEEMEQQYQSGYTSGYSSGYTSGYSSGYTRGDAEGYQSGVTHQKSLLTSLNVTQNGSYERENGYSAITVNVSGQQPSLVSTAVTVNGEYFPAQGYDGFSSVEVNVPQTGHTDQELEDAYNSGKTDGVAEQKAKLSAITITENGNYNRIDGYSAVTVYVEQTGYTEGYQSGYTDGYNDAYNLLGSIEVSPSYNNMHYNDTAITLTAVSNIPWTISSYPEWAVPNTLSGSGTTTINVTMPVNTGDERRGNIIFNSTSGEVSASVYIRQGYQPSQTLTGITLNNLTWVNDIPAAGGTATKDNCTYKVIAHYNNNTTGDVTTLATVTGSTVVSSSQVTSRHSAGTLTLTATYYGFSSSGSTNIYQSAYVQPTGLTDYLTFEIKSNGTIKWVSSGNTIYPISIWYRKNSGSWTEIRSAAEALAPSISVVNGDILEFRGNNSGYGPYSNYGGSSFKTNVSFELKGNIMSLISSTNFSTKTTLNQEAAFAGMFANCTGLTDASELVLPATTLTKKCYYGMFQGCTKLTTAPDLLATTISGVGSCYHYMFSGCTKLNYIKCLAYYPNTLSMTGWVTGVASSGTFVKNPSTTWSTGVNGIPTNWTVVNNS